ncbi:hypothetical protein [Pseudoalteromonas sp. GB56]
MFISKIRGFILLIICLLCSPVHATESLPVSANDEKAINALFANYMQHYNGYLLGQGLGDIDQLYMPTIMLMSTKNAPQSVSAQAFSQQVTGFLDGLKNKGVTKVQWQTVNVRMIDNNIALASNLAVRYTESGEVYNQVGATYLLYKEHTDWRIASFAVHTHTGVKSL